MYNEMFGLCWERCLAMDFSVIDILNLVVSVFAIIISVISLYKSFMTGRPYIKLVDMFFEPSEFHCYSLENCNGYEKLTDKHKDIIKKTLGGMHYQVIDGKNYILVNMLKEDFDIDNVRLILSPYQFTYINTGGFVTEINIIKGFFKLKNREKHMEAIGCMIVPEGIDHEEFCVRVAYACQDGFDTSVIYNRLLSEKERFSYKNDNEKARKIINFEEEKFIVKCRNNAKSRYTLKVVFRWDNNVLKFISK